MKKFVPIIIGLLVGLCVTCTMIVLNNNKVAHGEITWWNEIVAYGYFFDWSDIFTPDSQGKDLYNLVYLKLQVFPEKSALKEISQKYGLTLAEAEKASQGSISIIYNSAYKRDSKLTQEEAFIILENIMDDYEEFDEIFSLEQEIDAAITPSELFSNGDVMDSGFDLVHDLNIIEEILFMEETETTIGHEYPDLLDSPYLPTEQERAETDFIADESNVAVLSYPLESVESVFVNDEGDTVITVGEEEVEINVETEDECLDEEADFVSSIEDFEEEEDDQEAEGGERVIRSDSDEDLEDVGYDSDMGESIETPETIEELEPAQADQWLGSWCASENEDISVCFSTELIYETVSSYQPGDSCVMCEVEKINEILDKTLSYSLVPNKVTGNLMESAKCKDSYEVSAIDMQFIAIASPIATPMNDDIIYGKDTAEQWNKFIERYKPLLYPDLETPTEFALNYAPEDTTQLEILNEVNRIQNKAAAQAEMDVQNFVSANDGTNTMLYSQSVLAELRQMTAYFAHFQDIIRKINEEACPVILSKPDID